MDGWGTRSGWESGTGWVLLDNTEERVIERERLVESRRVGERWYTLEEQSRCSPEGENYRTRRRDEGARGLGVKRRGGVRREEEVGRGDI
eukprot:763359-Hanusia_phi.AAC.1